MKYKLKINLLASWGDHSVALLIGLFLMPFVLNTVGDEQYGLWLFICSIAGYTGLLNLGFGETVSRFVAHHHAKGETDQINRVVSVIGAVYVTMSLVVMSLAGGLAWLAPGLYDWSPASITEVRWVIAILGLNFVVGILGSVFGGVLMGLQRIDLERGFRTFSGIVRMLLTVFFLNREQALITLAVVFLLTTVVENVGYLCVVFRQLPGLRIGHRYLSLQTLRECSGFSVFALLDVMASKLIDATDSIVIGIVFGTKYIVPYYVAHRLMTFIVQPLQMIGAVVMPRGAQLGAHQRDDGLRVLVQKGLGLAFLLTAAFFIGAFYFGDHVLQAWIGRSYAESHTILLVLLAGQIIATPVHVLRGVLFGMGHVRVPSLCYVVEAIANLFLTLLLIPHFGLLGVALGTAIPVVIVELGFMLPFALRKLGFTPAVFLKQVLTPQLAPLGALWAYSVLVSMNVEVSPAWIPVVLVAAGGGAVLGAVWLGNSFAARRPHSA